MTDHKIMRGKDICPKLCNRADVNFQAQYRAQSHLQWSNRHYGACYNKYFGDNLNLMKHFVQLTRPLVDQANGTYYYGRRQIKESPELAYYVWIQYDDEKSRLVQTQGWLDFSWFQPTILRSLRTVQGICMEKSLTKLTMFQYVHNATTSWKTWSFHICTVANSGPKRQLFFSSAKSSFSPSGTCILKISDHCSVEDLGFREHTMVKGLYRFSTLPELNLCCPTQSDTL